MARVSGKTIFFDGFARGASGRPAAPHARLRTCERGLRRAGCRSGWSPWAAAPNDGGRTGGSMARKARMGGPPGANGRYGEGEGEEGLDTPLLAGNESFQHCPPFVCTAGEQTMRMHERYRDDCEVIEQRHVDEGHGHVLHTRQGGHEADPQSSRSFCKPAAAVGAVTLGMQLMQGQMRITTHQHLPLGIQPMFQCMRCMRCASTLRSSASSSLCPPTALEPPCLVCRLCPLIEALCAHHGCCSDLVQRSGTRK